MTYSIVIGSPSKSIVRPTLFIVATPFLVTTAPRISTKFYSVFVGILVSVNKNRGIRCIRKLSLFPVESVGDLGLGRLVVSAGGKLNYNHRLGYIPGYDSLIRYKTAQQKQKDWAKNVGRKGRRIAYATDRFDFGSSAYERKAMNQVFNASVGAMIGYNRLPFR